MGYDEYYDGVTLTTMNYDTYDWTLNYFLMLGDDKEANDGDGQYCRQDCTGHSLTVTSEVDQYVHIGAHIWQDRGYSWSWDCADAHYSDEQTHEFIDETTGKHFSLNGGDEDVWQEPVFMAAGSSHKIKVLWDWNRPEVTKDWSVTAWGEKGNVNVVHNDGIKTRHMPSSGLWDDEGGPDPIPEPGPVPDPTPEPTPDTCTDLDNGATDKDGDGCAMYWQNSGWCGNYDDEDFDSNAMCCACGGG